MLTLQIRKKLQKLYQIRYQKKFKKTQFQKSSYKPHFIQVKLNIKSLPQQKKQFLVKYIFFALLIGFFITYSLYVNIVGFNSNNEINNYIYESLMMEGSSITLIKELAVNLFCYDIWWY